MATPSLTEVLGLKPTQEDSDVSAHVLVTTRLKRVKDDISSVPKQRSIAYSPLMDRSRITNIKDTVGTLTGRRIRVKVSKDGLDTGGWSNNKTILDNVVDKRKSLTISPLLKT